MSVRRLVLAATNARAKSENLPEFAAIPRPGHWLVRIARIKTQAVSRNLISEQEASAHVSSIALEADGPFLSASCFAATACWRVRS